MTDSAHILVVDNYDSFVYTIVGYLQTLAPLLMWCVTTLSTSRAGCTGRLRCVLISPGPGAPAELRCQ